MNENELTGLLESLRRMGSDDLNVEVKESATTLSRDVWETVSAFANTAGGIIVLGVSERAGFVPVENFETEKVLNQFVAGMGDAGGRGKLANPPKYTIERVELQGTVVLVIAIEELDPSSKPCYVIERGAQGGSYKRIDDKDVPLSSTEVLALASYGRATPSDRDAVAGAGADNLDETLVAARARLTVVGVSAATGVELELRLPGMAAPLNAIHFGGWTGNEPGRHVHLAYRLTSDDYRGGGAIQLIVEHCMPV